MTKNRAPTYLPISYCVLCGNYGVLHEHEQYEDDFDPLDYDNYVDIDQNNRMIALSDSPSKDNYDRPLFTNMRIQTDYCNRFYKFPPTD